ncbi:hypothetical protein C8R46DRAFT_1212138 [Mycena filopes]|nr:hypothetical protein C8R46DRAFT_1212138 [Mycena filopes]
MLAAAALVLALAQTVVVAGAGLPPARHIPGLRPRNLPVIPKTCQGGCAPFAPFFDGAVCPVTQCCSTAFQDGYFDCFLCVGNATDAPDFTIAQAYVDVLTTSCITEGVTLPLLSLPGQDPNRTPTSALPAGASAIPVFPAEGSASASGSAVRGSSTRTSSSSTAHTASASASPSASQLSGASTSNSATASISGSASGSASGSTTAPPQSTATSPPSQSSVSAPGPTTSAPPSAASRPRAPLQVLGLTFAGLLAVLL